ncbi:hypothetical protein RI367_006907 [Sorochytrium milnesiophthora]
MVGGKNLAGLLTGPGWDSAKCCDAKTEDCLSAEPTPMEETRPIDLRPLWIGTNKACVLASKTAPTTYELMVTIPQLNTPEKCITNMTTQRRHAAHHLTWTKDDKCVLYQYKTHTKEPSVHYVLDVEKTVCCPDGSACSSAQDLQLASSQPATPISDTIVSVRWERDNVCLFASTQDQLGYIKNATKEQCEGLENKFLPKQSKI